MYESLISSHCSFERRGAYYLFCVKTLSATGVELLVEFFYVPISYAGIFFALLLGIDFCVEKAGGGSMFTSLALPRWFYLCALIYLSVFWVLDIAVYPFYLGREFLGRKLRIEFHASEIRIGRFFKRSYDRADVEFVCVPLPAITGTAFQNSARLCMLAGGRTIPVADIYGVDFANEVRESLTVALLATTQYRGASVSVDPYAPIQPTQPYHPMANFLNLFLRAKTAVIQLHAKFTKKK